MIGTHDARDVSRLIEELEQEPDIDPTLLVDQTELEEAGAVFQDPELLVSLQGGMDDPDGLDGPPPPHRTQDEWGWDLSAPLVRGGDENDETDATEPAPA
jgi:hypothetical protein